MKRPGRHQLRRFVWRVPAGGLVAAVAASTALAAGEPEVFASSRIGHLDVTSSVLVGPTSVDMRGGWVDTARPCSETRLLDVKVDVERIESNGRSRRVRRMRTFRTTNCAEGGPNMGFTFRARAIGFGCANGRWKPGRYDFTTTTVEHRKRLRAVASVSWAKLQPC
ncbi:MAG TPA: hypothetical protein VGC78_10695 [Gaiellaceae bacterium]|jgi:hypothetical protein